MRLFNKFCLGMIIQQRETNLENIKLDIISIQEQLEAFTDLESFSAWDTRINEQTKFEADLIVKKSGKFERDRQDYMAGREFSWKKDKMFGSSSHVQEGDSEKRDHPACSISSNAGSGANRNRNYIRSKNKNKNKHWGRNNRTRTKNNRNRKPNDRLDYDPYRCSVHEDFPPLQVQRGPSGDFDHNDKSNQGNQRVGDPIGHDPVIGVNPLPQKEITIQEVRQDLAISIQPTLDVVEKQQESPLKSTSNDLLGVGRNVINTKTANSKDEISFFVQGAAGRTKPVGQKSIAFRPLSPPNTRRQLKRREEGAGEGGNQERPKTSENHSTIKILNLSKCEFLDTELELLRRGLSYAPESPPNLFELFIDLNKFVQNLTVKCHFRLKEMAQSMRVQK